MPDLPGHDGAPHSLALERFDQLRKLSQRQPVNRGSVMVLDLGGCLFLHRDDHDFISRSARRIQHEQRKPAVTRDEAKLFLLGGHEVRPQQKDAESV